MDIFEKICASVRPTIRLVLKLIDTRICKLCTAVQATAVSVCVVSRAVLLKASVLVSTVVIANSNTRDVLYLNEK